MSKHKPSATHPWSRAIVAASAESEALKLNRGRCLYCARVLGISVKHVAPTYCELAERAAGRTR